MASDTVGSYTAFISRLERAASELQVSTEELNDILIDMKQEEGNFAEILSQAQSDSVITTAEFDELVNLRNKCLPSSEQLENTKTAATDEEKQIAETLSGIAVKMFAELLE